MNLTGKTFLGYLQVPDPRTIRERCLLGQKNRNKKKSPEFENTLLGCTPGIYFKKSGRRLNWNDPGMFLDDQEKKWISFHITTQ